MALPINLQNIDYSKSGFVSGFNNDLIGKALLYKQEKYDKSREELQGFVNDLSGIDLAKPEDRRYFEDKLKILQTEVNRVGMGDLSRTGVKEHLESYIGQAADDKVLNGYSSTIQVNRYVQESQKLKEKHPELWNQKNYEFGLQNVNAWMSDGKAGTSVSDYKNNWSGSGVGSVIPYTDLNKKVIDILKNTKPDIKVVSTPYGVQFLNSKYEVLAPQEIKDIMDNLIYTDPQIAQQVKINSWGQYKDIPDEAVSPMVKNSYEQQRNTIQETITKQQNQMSKLSANEKINAQNYISNLQHRLNGINTDLNNWDATYETNSATYKQDLYKQDMTSGFISMFAKNNLIDISSITDEGALEVLKNKNSLARQRMGEVEKMMLEAGAAGDTGKMIDIGRTADAMGVSSSPVLNPFTGKKMSWEQWAQGLSSTMGVPTAGETPTDPKKAPEVSEELKKEKQINQTSYNQLKQKLKNVNPDIFLKEDISNLTDVLNTLNNSLTNSVADEALKTEIVNQLGAYSIQRKSTDRKVEKATQSLEEQAKANPGERIPMGDGRYTWWEDGQLKYQDRASILEGTKYYGGSALSEIGRVFAKTYQDITSNISLPNLTPRKGDKAIVLNQALNNPETYINNLIGETPVSDYELITRKKNLITKLNNLKQTGASDVSQLSWSRANDIYNEIDNLVSAGESNRLRVGSLDNRELKQNQGFGYAISSDELKNIVRTSFDNGTLGGKGLEIFEQTLAEDYNKGGSGYGVKTIDFNDARIYKNRDAASVFRQIMKTNIDFEKDKFKADVIISPTTTEFTLKLPEEIDNGIITKWADPIKETVPNSELMKYPFYAQKISDYTQPILIEEKNKQAIQMLNNEEQDFGKNASINLEKGIIKDEKGNPLQSYTINFKHYSQDPSKFIVEIKTEDKTDLTEVKKRLSANKTFNFDKGFDDLGVYLGYTDKPMEIVDNVSNFIKYYESVLNTEIPLGRTDRILSAHYKYLKQ